MAKVDEERSRRIESLVRKLESFPDPESRNIAQALMEAILELHGAGLERMMDIVFDAGDFGKTAIRQFAGDDLVAGLLVLHGLHPDDIQTRVQHALGKMHGNAELLGVFDGSVRIRLTGSGCGLKDSVEAAVREAVPDATEIIVEEIGRVHGFVPLTSLGAAVVRSA
ncbi:MAG: NifU family protein [Bryobacteraceae bacterium]